MSLSKLEQSVRPASSTHPSPFTGQDRPDALALLRQAVSKSVGPTPARPPDRPSARLLSSTVPNQDLATLRSALADAHAAVDRVGHGEALSIRGALDRAGRGATGALDHAFGFVLAVMQRTQEAPDDLSLQQQAQEALAEFQELLQGSREVHALRLDGYRDLAALDLVRTRGLAHDVQALAETTLASAAGRLRAAGGLPDTVADLRALLTPEAAASGASSPSELEALFSRAIGEADMVGDKAAVAALKGARSALVEAGRAAMASMRAETAFGELMHIRTQAMLAEEEAFDPEGAVRDQREAVMGMGRSADRCGMEVGKLQSAAADAAHAAQAAAASVASVDAASTREEVVPESRAAGVEAGPAGVPGEMAVGGTLVQIDPAADAALNEAGAQAGAAARGAVDAAVARHGAGPRGALDEASQAATLAQSQALAKAMLAHPRLAAVLRIGGKAVGAAALAAITLQLGEAIHTDVKAGNRGAPATRKVLEDILGGTALGLGGAAVGARIGVAIGGLAGPVTAAVGGFIGGLFGGALGYAAGAKLVDEAIAAEKRPLAHLIDGLLGDKAPSEHEGAAIVKASGSQDDHVNAKELRQGLKALNLETNIGERQMAALINAYGSRGLGALSPADLDRALAEGALAIDRDNRVAVEPLEFTLNLDTPGQERRAAHIAKRLVNLGSSGQGKDRRLNTQELMTALEDAGCNRSIDEGRFARLVAAYDRSGEGALGEDEIAKAIQDGALEFDAQGGVTVHDQGITGQAGSSAENIALRIVKAGSKDDLLCNSSELKAGMKEAAFHPELGKEDWQALIASHGDAASGLIGPDGVAKAIADGALLIDPQGRVKLNSAV